MAIPMGLVPTVIGVPAVLLAVVRGERRWGGDVVRADVGHVGGAAVGGDGDPFGVGAHGYRCTRGVAGDADGGDVARAVVRHVGGRAVRGDGDRDWLGAHRDRRPRGVAGSG